LKTLPAYRAGIEPEWIDYNGHLRDAYYGVVLSLAIDDVMDVLGLDAEYRGRTRCTLYTLELHMHYLHEVKSTDELEVVTSILDADRKRIHAGCRFSCPRLGDAVATGEVMLLHVTRPDTPASASFPPDIGQRIEALKLTDAERAAWGPGSPQDRTEAPRHRMTVDIRRLIAPRSIALIGAGAWTDAVAAGNRAIGYPGVQWRVHPTRPSTAANTYYRSIADLPGVPDAAFHRRSQPGGAVRCPENWPRARRRRLRMLHRGFLRDRQRRGSAAHPGAGRSRGKSALLRTQLLRLREFSSIVRR